MRTASTCPVCDCKSDWEPFIAFHNVPRTGIFPASPPAFVLGRDLLFEYCPECGLIRQQGFTPDDGDPDYANVDRSTAAQLPGYLKEVTRDIVRLCPDRQALLVDVGGNDGSFLAGFLKEGYEHCLNVEPSRALARKSGETGCRALCRPLNQETANLIVAEHGRAGVVFLRHVLEHVADPVAMLRAVHSLLDDQGVFCLEFPDSCGIVEYGMAHELWEEHLYYFSPSTAEALLRKTGFTISTRASFPHRGGCNTLFRARKVLSDEDNKGLFRQSVSEALPSFRQRWDAYCADLHRAALSWPKPVYMLGASHPQTNFIHFSGIAHLIDYAIDDDSAKAGRFLNMQSAVPIVTTERFRELADKGTLLLTAWGCDSWTDRVKAIAQSRGMYVVSPYQLG